MWVSFPESPWSEYLFWRTEDCEELPWDSQSLQICVHFLTNRSFSNIWHCLQRSHSNNPNLHMNVHKTLPFPRTLLCTNSESNLCVQWMITLHSLCPQLHSSFKPNFNNLFRDSAFLEIFNGKWSKIFTESHFPSCLMFQTSCLPCWEQFHHMDCCVCQL